MGGRGAKGVKGDGGAGGKELSPTKKLASRMKIAGVSSLEAAIISKEAAALINGTRKTGYTVYSAHRWAGPDEYYAGVGYGAGETKYAINQMKRILRDGGFIVSDHPDGGLMVGLK